MGSHDRRADTGSHTDETMRRPGWLRRHRSLFIAFASLIGVVVVAALVFAFALNQSLSNIVKVPVTLHETDRPEPTQGKALNILLLGADAGTKRNGAGSSILNDAASANWPTGKYRSDATMVVHINADRKKAYVVSIPRDSYVKVYDGTGEQRDTTKINAALSLYGPVGAISTVENFTDLRIDHLAMVDWDGFEAITNALGGVTVAVPGQGAVKLKGEGALEYVRERYNLPNGDFDRVRRQQNFIRAIMTKLVEKGTLTNPVRLKNTLDSFTTNMAVDEGWSTSDMRSLGFSMRGIRPANVTFLTIPTRGTADDPIAGSIVLPDKEKSAQLFESFRADDVEEFLTANPDIKLGKPEEVH